MNYYKVTISDNTGSMYLTLLGSSTKEVEVEVNSVDENDVVGFLNDIKRFEVK